MHIKKKVLVTSFPNSTTATSSGSYLDQLISLGAMTRTSAFFFFFNRLISPLFKNIASP